jgi:hypothetical protein
LGQAALFAQFFYPPPNFLLRCIFHCPNPCCIWVISHRGRCCDSVHHTQKNNLFGRYTFTYGISPDTIAVMHLLLLIVGAFNI